MMLWYECTRCEVRWTGGLDAPTCWLCDGLPAKVFMPVMPGAATYTAEVAEAVA